MSDPLAYDMPESTVGIAVNPPTRREQNGTMAWKCYHGTIILDDEAYFPPSMILAEHSRRMKLENARLSLYLKEKLSEMLTRK